MTDINFRIRPRIITEIVSYGWASDEAHLTFLVTDEYPNTVKNLGSIISTLENELGRLEQKVMVINDVVLDVAEANVQPLLEAKRVSNAWYGPVDYIGDFGNSNISDWQIWDVGTGGGIAGTGTGPGTFTTIGDTTPLFPNGSPVTVNPGGIIRLVASAVFAIGPGLTTVTLQAGAAIPLGALTAIPGQIVYVYNGVGWDSDAAITQEVESFATGYDHLTHTLGLTGTYGLNERIAQLETGRDLQDANKAAYENFIIWYEPYMQ
jgi:hypothetical protein